MPSSGPRTATASARTGSSIRPGAPRVFFRAIDASRPDHRPPPPAVMDPRPGPRRPDRRARPPAGPPPARPGPRAPPWAGASPAEGDRVIAGLFTEHPAWLGPYGHRQIIERTTGLVIGSIGVLWPPDQGALE